MIKASKGISELGYTEVQLVKNISAETLIVINGAFDVLAKKKNSDE